MTVEASYLIPLCLVTFAVIIYTAFFMYDRCLFNQDAYIIAFKESIQKDPADAEKIRNSANQVLADKYFVLRANGITFSDEGDLYFVNGSAAFMPSVFSSSPLMPQSIRTIRFGAKARRSDPCAHIRKYRRVLFVSRTAAEKLTGVKGGSAAYEP